MKKYLRPFGIVVWQHPMPEHKLLGTSFAFEHNEMHPLVKFRVRGSDIKARSSQPMSVNMFASENVYGDWPKFV